MPGVLFLGAAALGVSIAVSIAAARLSAKGSGLAKGKARRAAPAYWCTWQAQSRVWMDGAAGMDQADAEAYWTKWRAHDPEPGAQGYAGWDAYINETLIFGTELEATASTPAAPAPSSAPVPWANLFPRSRHQLFFSLDNGYQAKNKLALDPKKFPSFKANSTAASFKLFSDKIKALGWRGLAVWIPGSRLANRENIQMLSDVGVGLLKVDGGDAKCGVTRLAREIDPALAVEHGTCNGDCPLNGPGTGPDASARWPWSAASIQAVILNCSDLMRTYDMVQSLSVSEVIDRQYKLLNKSAHWPVDEHSADRNFDGSGEPMVTAALGGVIQPMDSTAVGLGIPDAFQVYANGPPGRVRLRDNAPHGLGGHRAAVWGRCSA